AGDNVSQFTIGVDGGLSPKSPPSVAAGDYPFDVAVSPDGKSVYVASMLSYRVFQYDVGQGGKLSPKSPATVFADSAVAVAVSPDGRSVYVINAVSGSGCCSSDNVHQFDVGPSGALVPKCPPRVATGKYPDGVAVIPDGENVFVANAGNWPQRGNISQY